MGRTWDAFKRDSEALRESISSRAEPTPAEDAEPMLAETEEIPFIEVGPHKSIEASPSVLAYEKNKGREDKKTQNIAYPLPKPFAPRNESFHGVVFLVAPGTETP